MPILETISTSDAAGALGVKPACIRLHLKAGKLSGVRFGRSWRIHLSSLNELLAGFRTVNGSSMAPKPVVMESRKSSPCIAQNDGACQVQSSSPTANDRSSVLQNDLHAQPLPVGSELSKSHLPQPSPTPNNRPKPLFDDNDMVWINRYRRDLTDANPQVRADAKWHLERFAQRSEQDATRRVAARLTVEEAKAMAAALLASSPHGDRTWW